jgi:phosphoribosyl 1,2-cyclic phosphodiesterase
MTERVQQGVEAIGPVENLRVRFWGVQGSCPVHPPLYVIREYTRQVALHTLEQALKDITDRAKKANGGAAGPIRVGIEDLLGGAPTAEAIAEYQRKLGLPDLPVYGGETTCIEVETADGEVLVFDGGSGIRHFALSILKRWKDRENRTLHFFGSHEHLDHRSGLPFSRFVFIRNNPFTINVYGSYRFLQALDERFGIFCRKIGETTHLDDPLDYTMMAATFNGTELRNTEDPGGYMRDVTTSWKVRDIKDPVRIGNTTITPFNVYHGLTRVLAYKIERNGKSFVFCTDHELRHGDDPTHERQRESMAAEERLQHHCKNADVGYFDGQYRIAEYLGQKGIGTAPPVPKMDWGHGCIEDVVRRALQCKIKHTFIGHHDPDREWGEQLTIDRELNEQSAGTGCYIELAKPDTAIDL